MLSKSASDLLHSTEYTGWIWGIGIAGSSAQSFGLRPNRASARFASKLRRLDRLALSAVALLDIVRRIVIVVVIFGFACKAT